MTSMNVSTELKQAAERKNVTQLSLARKTFKAHTTVSGYFNKEETPLDAIQDLSSVLQDSTFAQQMAHKTYGTLPVMESETYHETPHALELLQEKEANERKARKNDALMILCKQDRYLTEQDKAELRAYVNEFLDEMLIEMKLVLSILDKVGVSFMQAVKDRTPYWIVQNYLRR